jgi:hypothetical protein
MNTERIQKQVEAVAESIINGQFTQARNQAKRLGWRTLFVGFREIGWPEVEATRRADQMKEKR